MTNEKHKWWTSANFPRSDSSAATLCFSSQDERTITVGSIVLNGCLMNGLQEAPISLAFSLRTSRNRRGMSAARQRRPARNCGLGGILRHQRCPHWWGTGHKQVDTRPTLICRGATLMVWIPEKQTEEMLDKQQPKWGTRAFSPGRPQGDVSTVKRWELGSQPSRSAQAQSRWWRPLTIIPPLLIFVIQYWRMTPVQWGRACVPKNWDSGTRHLFKRALGTHALDGIFQLLTCSLSSCVTLIQCLIDVGRGTRAPEKPNVLPCQPVGILKTYIIAQTCAGGILSWGRRPSAIALSVTWRSGCGFPCYLQPVIRLLLCSPLGNGLRSFRGAGAGAAPRRSQLTRSTWVTGWRWGDEVRTFYSLAGDHDSSLAHIFSFRASERSRGEPETGGVPSMPGPWVPWARTRTFVDNVIHNVPRASVTSAKEQPSHRVSMKTQSFAKVSRCFLNPQIHCLHKSSHWD